MICLSRLGVLNLPTIWSPRKYSKKDKASDNTDRKSFQRPLERYTKRGYMKWFGRLSHCSKSNQGRMYPRM
ncbi:hypothetical protein KR018_006434 [Drosophila ironensis]|nr:hypothetical protein KR018_006434 [Drosophila ironensis]